MIICVKSKSGRRPPALPTPIVSAPTFRFPKHIISQCWTNRFSKVTDSLIGISQTRVDKQFVSCN